MKLRYFYKIDHNKQPILGSNIRRKSKPSPYSQWKEILDPCCIPNVIDCTCGPRFFVQLDGQGKPVDGTLIKRNEYPKMSEGIRYMELSWKSVCCEDEPVIPALPTVSWSFAKDSDTEAEFYIEITPDGEDPAEVLHGTEAGSGDSDSNPAIIPAIPGQYLVRVENFDEVDCLVPTVSLEIKSYLNGEEVETLPNNFLDTQSNKGALFVPDPTLTYVITITATCG